MERKAYFVIDNINNSVIPKKGESFINHNHRFYELGAQKPSAPKLPYKSIITEVIPLDIFSNYFLAITEDSFLIFPIRRIDFNKDTLIKKIYFTKMKRIPDNGRLKDIRLYSVSEKASIPAISHQYFDRTEFFQYISPIYFNIYMGESYIRKLVIFTNQQY